EARKLMKIFFKSDRNGIRNPGFKTERQKFRISDITPIPFNVFIKIFLIDIEKLQQQCRIHIRGKLLVSDIDIIYEFIKVNPFFVAVIDEATRGFLNSLNKGGSIRLSPGFLIPDLNQGNTGQQKNEGNQNDPDGNSVSVFRINGHGLLLGFW